MSLRQHIRELSGSSLAEMSLELATLQRARDRIEYTQGFIKLFIIHQLQTVLRLRDQNGFELTQPVELPLR